MIISSVFFSPRICFIDNQVQRIYNVDRCVAKAFDGHVSIVVNKIIFEVYLS